MQLAIGNKNYSSWSMRPWVLMKQAGIPFEEVMLRFDAFSPGSAFKRRLAGLTPAGGHGPPLARSGRASLRRRAAFARLMRPAGHPASPGAPECRLRARKLPFPVP